MRAPRRERPHRVVLGAKLVRLPPQYREGLRNGIIGIGCVTQPVRATAQLLHARHRVGVKRGVHHKRSFFC